MLRMDRLSTTLVRLTMDRPPANALTLDLIQALADDLARFGEEAEAPAVILTGAGGRFFSAGGDIREITINAKAAIPRMRAFHRLLTALERYRCPLLCAVNGYAVGGALELVLFADHVVASDGAKFGFPEINHGLLPAAKGMRQAMNRLGRRAAERLLYSGELVSAQEAQAIGLVDEIVSFSDLQDRTRVVAETLRLKDMHLFSAIKRTFNDAAQMTDDELEERSLSDMQEYLNREETAAARERFLQRKTRQQHG
ncbi:enoyl-CoA hydratase/isomerase family protein (plasmid) [Azospirillum oryzae]|uniref:Enoyl-CoA hydratase/isomerase family protein n=2 Tax=Azospirillum oryzae TaxID=286727 RepID=A0A6N1AGL8_9PROT|nr:enoyl-CoA hydratase/isomerase family protein [Azospirillum oryzae]KAA0585732.1 enoyl-CoA hydratase/isomerase family protein [Azospirillum oryzae]QKS49527.1 enoyl-CoA hydratase/isomerase family protein [Azospirillum oryzae]GLR78873.1 crotonase [Azospirillum oryzae]